MTCIYCQGTGKDAKENKQGFMQIIACPVCEGTGQVCDTCGAPIPDDGDYLCTDCDTPGDK